MAVQRSPVQLHSSFSFSDLPPDIVDDIAHRVGPFNNVVCVDTHAMVKRPENQAPPRTETAEPPARPYSVRLDDYWSNDAIKTVSTKNEPSASPITRTIGSSHGCWLITIHEDATVTARAPDASSSGLHATRSSR
uniref:Uncharacterized protein n=1 Tax=Leersia perrieri TaxID=77586 RepID=A0A0D9VA47_9ORYZ